MNRFLVLFFTILLASCSDKSPNTPISQDDSLNVPFILTNENYFEFKLKADSLSDVIHQTLNFNEDSLTIIFRVKNSEQGYGSVYLTTIENNVFYRSSLSYDLNEPGAHLFDIKPSDVMFHFDKFTGEVEFKICATSQSIVSDTIGSTVEYGSVYFNSFETSSDLLDFEDDAYNISNDVSPCGGIHSLELGGVYYEFAPATEDSKFIVQCWGKTLLDGGGVAIGIKNTSSLENVNLWVEKNEWEFLQSPDTLFCPRDSILYLKMVAGGRPYSTMLVDLVQVIKLE